MSGPMRSKVKNSHGLSWIIAIMLVLVLALAAISMYPVYRRYQEQADELACATGLDTARRQLAADFMLSGFENSDAEGAKALVANVMNGWDDLCPSGGTVYIVRREDSPLDWDVICGLHCSDKKLCTRLNAYNVLEQLREALLKEQNKGNIYPESLPFTLHGKTYNALLTDKSSGLKRGTSTTEGYEKKDIVAFYSLVGHSDYGADSGMNKEGGLWYFSFADREHCANWTYRENWTGDSYRGVS